MENSINNLRFRCHFGIEGGIVAFELDLVEFVDEGGMYIVHCPALHLSGYGSTPDAAQQSFAATMEGYLHYTTTNNTLVDDLRDQGWDVQKNEKIKSIHPPREYRVEVDWPADKMVNFRKSNVQLEDHAYGAACN